METWIVKTQTDDPQRALVIVKDQRSRGYNAWIEDESGTAVDEGSLKNDNVKSVKFSLRENGKGLLVGLGAAAAAIVTLYAVGLWVDH
jgi:hypothetical protein